MNYFDGLTVHLRTLLRFTFLWTERSEKGFWHVRTILLLLLGLPVEILAERSILMDLVHFAFHVLARHGRLVIKVEGHVGFSVMLGIVGFLLEELSGSHVRVHHGVTWGWHRARKHGALVHGTLIHGTMDHATLVHVTLVHGALVPKNLVHGFLVQKALVHKAWVHGTLVHGSLVHSSVNLHGIHHLSRHWAGSFEGTGVGDGVGLEKRSAHSHADGLEEGLLGEPSEGGLRLHLPLQTSVGSSCHHLEDWGEE